MHQAADLTLILDFLEHRLNEDFKLYRPSYLPSQAIDFSIRKLRTVQVFQHSLKVKQSRLS